MGDNDKNNMSSYGTDDSDIAVFDDFSYEEEKEDENYLYHAKENVSTEDVSVGKSILDFAREAEENERLEKEAEYDASDHGLDDVEVSEGMLSDMDYYGNSRAARVSNTLRKQMELDDFSMKMGRAPQLSEMSEKYSPSKKNAGDLSDKDILDRDEKKRIKERLENEINKRPDNFNKRQSAEMYHALMYEQQVKQSRKGFYYVLFFAALGVVSAFVTYYRLNWNDTELFTYISIGAAIASIMMFIRSRIAKMLSCLYFAFNTVILVGPGLVKFVTDPAPKEGNFNIILAFFISAIAMSAVACIGLFTNAEIDAYYTLRKRKAAAEKKPAARRVVKRK